MTFRETELLGRPAEWTELWRGQFRGTWFRIVINFHYRLEFQASHNASLGEEQEIWEVQYSV